MCTSITFKGKNFRLRHQVEFKLDLEKDNFLGQSLSEEVNLQGKGHVIFRRKITSLNTPLV